MELKKSKVCVKGSKERKEFWFMRIGVMNDDSYLTASEEYNNCIPPPPVRFLSVQQQLSIDYGKCMKHCLFYFCYEFEDLLGSAPDGKKFENSGDACGRSDGDESNREVNKEDEEAVEDVEVQNLSEDADEIKINILYYQLSLLIVY